MFGILIGSASGKLETGDEARRQYKTQPKHVHKAEARGRRQWINTIGATPVRASGARHLLKKIEEAFIYFI